MAEELIARRIESGIPPVFPAVPLVVGDALIVRRSEELTAYNLLDGESRWSVDLSSSGSGSQESEALADRAFSGGPQWALSGDRERVYAVVEDAATYYRPVFTPRGRRIPVELPAKNSLCAYDLRTGNRAWRLNEIGTLGASSATTHGDRDVDFLGPPLVCGGTLYVLGRTDEGACLLALNPADGTVPLGRKSGGIFRLRGRFGFRLWSGLRSAGTRRLAALSDTRRNDHRNRFGDADLPLGLPHPPTEEPSRLPPRWGRRFPAVEARWLNGWRKASFGWTTAAAFSCRHDRPPFTLWRSTQGKFCGRGPSETGCSSDQSSTGGCWPSHNTACLPLIRQAVPRFGVRPSAFLAAAASLAEEVTCCRSRPAGLPRSTCGRGPSIIHLCPRRPHSAT